MSALGEYPAFISWEPEINERYESETSTGRIGYPAIIAVEGFSGAEAGSRMITVHRLICTWLGIGYIGKGSGTITALCCCVFWYLLCRNGYNSAVQVGIILVIISIGIWSAGKVEAAWGKDSNKVVIDEAAGMFISLVFLPVQWKYIIPAFILFRFFDIVKPLFIRRLEKLPGGWGVMADDLLAGIYSNVILQGIVISNLF